MPDLSHIDWIAGAMQYIVFIFSTILHEAAHAAAALRLGDDTAHRGGQVTLNPAPHIRREPFGMVVVPIMSFVLGGWMIGWASAPYDPEWALRHPRRSALMSLAGPAANALLVMLSVAIMLAGVHAGIFRIPDTMGWMRIVVAPEGGVWVAAATMLSLFFSMNVLLCAFNLIPLPPLDGSALPLLALTGSPARSYIMLTQHPALSWIGIIVAWKLFGVVFPTIWHNVIRIFFGS